MRIVPPRGPWIQALTVLLAFAAGPALGVLLARGLAPGSILVDVVSPFAFAAVFVLGLLAWMGWGIAVVVGKALRDLVRGRAPRRGAERGREVPPGYRAFPLLGALVGGVAGLVAGLATDLTVWAGGAAWGVGGLGYGLALWAAAHHGYLPFPEPE